VQRSITRKGRERSRPKRFDPRSRSLARLARNPLVLAIFTALLRELLRIAIGHWRQ